MWFLGKSKDFADSFDLKALDDMEHGHVPYVVLLIKFLEEWKNTVKIFIFSFNFLYYSIMDLHPLLFKRK